CADFREKMSCFRNYFGCLLYYGFSNRLTIVAIEWAIIARGFISSLEATNPLAIEWAIIARGFISSLEATKSR
ncbi:hypothetical protein ACUOCP_41540, partial [Escherichia sp. R-CC3]